MTETGGPGPAPVSLVIVVPPTQGDGLERGLAILLDGLDRDIVRPQLVLTHSRTENARLMAKVPRDVPIIELRKRGFADQWRLVRALARHYEAVDADVVIGVNIYASVLALGARLRARRRPTVIATEHASPDRHRRLRVAWLLWAARMLYRRADSVIAVSAGTAVAVARTFRIAPDRVAVIHPAFDPRLDERLTDTTALDPPMPVGVPVVVYVGRLSPEKGVDCLIQAIRIVKDRMPVRLLIIGDGPERRPIARLITQLGLGDVVTLAGFVPDPYRYMAAADVHAVPSIREAFGTVIIEGMRSAAAIVATNCDYGPREIITDGRNGLLVRAGDPVAMARAIERVLSEPGLGPRLRAHAHRDSARYEARTMVVAYQDLIAELGCRRSAAPRSAAPIPQALRSADE